ncbi:MAG: glutathione S-transferase family protein [Candidatus Nucleicultricaceae bacterium]
MRTLFHHPLCPFSRKVRLFLAEKNLEFSLHLEPVWQKRSEFLDLNPAGKVPVLVDHNVVVSDSVAICEYLDEAYNTSSLIGETIAERAESRRLSAWIDESLYDNVVVKIVYEKLFKRYFEKQHPDSAEIRAGVTALHDYLGYITWLIDRRYWLAGERLSLADITAAAHLSTLDYLSHIPWDDYPEIKEWYCRLKSRPSFRPLLLDQMPGVHPPKHYWDLDF